MPSLRNLDDVHPCTHCCDHATAPATDAQPSLAVNMGAATLWMAVFADMGASLIVVFNGLRLLRGKHLTQ